MPHACLRKSSIRCRCSLCKAAALQLTSNAQGKEICAALSIKPSKALAGIIAKVVERQLEHPDESKEDAAKWLRDEVDAGRISTS